MTQHEHVKIIAIVGLAGTGKSTAVDYFTEAGMPKVYFGGVVLGAMTEAGIEHTKDNEQVFREELRQKYGKEVVANLITEQIHGLIAAGQHQIVADGLYTWSEYKVLKHIFPGELVVVAVTAPKHLRYQRLARRPVRPLTEEETRERDWAEIENLEKGGPIAIADYTIINDGSIEELRSKLAAVKQEIGI